jgi:hypothetical protein
MSGKKPAKKVRTYVQLVLNGGFGTFFIKGSSKHQKQIEKNDVVFFPLRFITAFLGVSWHWRGSSKTPKKITFFLRLFAKGVSVRCTPPPS